MMSMIILIVVIAVILFWLIGMYNSLIRLRNQTVVHSN